VVVVGPLKEPSVPETAAEAAAVVGLVAAVTPPGFYWTAPLWAYGAGACAGKIHKTVPDLEARFGEAVAREFSQAKLRATFVEEMKARTSAPVAPFDEPAGTGYFGHATALTEGARQGVDLVVELVEPIVALRREDDCEHAYLSLSSPTPRAGQVSLKKRRCATR
jgi:succinylarginine dihydrolase